MKAIMGFVFISYLLMLSACGRQRSAIGNETEILVVADSLLYQSIAPELKSALERTLLTPQLEKLFTLKYLPRRSLGKAVVRHYVIMAGTLYGQDQTSREIRPMLSEKLLQQVKEGKSFVFRKENLWAKNQLFLVLVAKDLPTLVQQIADNKDYLFQILRKDLFQKTANEMFSQLEQKDLENQFLEKYGWTMRIQHDYIVYRKDEKHNFVMLRRTSPERWLFVYWEKSDDPDIISREWMLATRNRIGRKYYENDTVVDSLWHERETQLGKRWALEVDGLWENKQKVAGGPFKSFGFYDQTTKRAYLIDIAVFAPGLGKELFLRQLEVMARSFKTAADVQLADKK